MAWIFLDAHSSSCSSLRWISLYILRCCTPRTCLWIMIAGWLKGLKKTASFTRFTSSIHSIRRCRLAHLRELHLVTFLVSLEGWTAGCFRVVGFRVGFRTMPGHRFGGIDENCSCSKLVCYILHLGMSCFFHQQKQVKSWLGNSFLWFSNSFGKEGFCEFDSALCSVFAALTFSSLVNHDSWSWRRTHPTSYWYLVGL